MIEIRTKKVTIPDSLKGMDQKVKKSITEALFSELDVVGAVHSVRTNYLYKRLKKNTGKLGDSMIPEKRRINQYASMFGFYFDPKIAPHATAQISVGAGIFTITAAKGKKLAIPIKGGPAYRVKSRIAPKDLGGDSDPDSSAFASRKNKLYLKGTVNRVPYFVLKQQVQIPQRVYADELLREFERELTPQMNRIALKVVSGLGQ